MIKTFIGRIKSFNLNIFNPFLNLELETLSHYCGTNEYLQRKVPLVVSISAEPSEYKDLPKTIFSLLSQSLKPDRIILWLSCEDDDLTTIPYEISQFIKNGLEIVFTDNLSVYTKTIKALELYRDSIIVTASSNIYYPNGWLKKLYMSYISNPNDIHVHKAFTVNPLNSFSLEKNSREHSSYKNFINELGGVLYPPNCYSNEVFRKDIYLKYAPTNCESWFWIMALLNEKKINIVKNHIDLFFVTNIFKYFKQKACQNNINNKKQAEFLSLMKFYKQNVIHKLQDTPSK